MRRNIFFLLIFLLILPTVSAQFLAFGETTIDALQCTTQTSNVTIQNTKTTPHNYELSVGGKGADFVKFSELNFALNPLESKTIYTFYTIPCETKTGDYPVEIYFSDGEDELALNQDLYVTQPVTLIMQTMQSSQVITPCEEAKYQLTIKNPSDTTELYFFEAEGHEDFEIIPETAVLLSNQTKNITAAVMPQDCTDSGIYLLTVSAETEKTEQVYELPLELIITPTGIPIIAEDVKKIKTGYEESTVKITIENTGDKNTTYTLTHDGPEWMKIQPQTITIEPNLQETITLQFSPSEEAKSDSYKVELKAKTDDTEIEYSKQLTVVLSRPGFIQKHPALSIILLVVIIFLIVFIILLVIYLRSDSFKKRRELWRKRSEEKKKLALERRKQRLKQIEERRKQRDAERRRREEAKRKEEERRRELKRKEEERKIETKRREEEKRQARERRLSTEIKSKKELKSFTKREKILSKREDRKSLSQIEKELRQKYHLIERQAILQGKKPGSGKHFFALAVLILILILLTLFWNLILPNKLYVGIGLLTLIVLLLIKKILRQTTFTAKIKLLIDKQTKTIKAWNKGLKELSITAEKAIKNYHIRLKKISSRNVPAPAVYQTFKLEQNGPAKIEGTFKVSKKWLTAKRIEADALKLGKFINNNWKSQQLEKTGEDQRFAYYKADLKDGTYSIYGKPLPVKKEPRSKKAIIITGVLLLALIAAFAVTLIHPKTLPGAIPAQTWKQDTVHKLNLADYFKDPDGDQLTYTATATNKITIDFIKNTAVLTPAEGFTGEELVKFTAKDTKGASVTSNSVPLRVKKTILPGYVQQVAGIVLGLLAVLVLIWMAVNLKKK